jgi:hypothetical protein
MNIPEDNVIIKGQVAFGLVPHLVAKDISMIDRQYLNSIKDSLNTFATGEMEQPVSGFSENLPRLTLIGCRSYPRKRSWRH